jgi:activator of HSP90 ATPase
MSKIVTQTVTLHATPAKLYAMYLDPEQHAAFTGGGPAQMTGRAGTDWSAFGGRIYGRVLALTQNRQIVQSWRSFEWKDDELDSVLVLTFWPEGESGRVELIHANVPDRLYETLVSGWPSRYWVPWRSFLEDRMHA